MIFSFPDCHSFYLQDLLGITFNLQEEARRQINPRDGWIPEEPAAAAAVILSHASSRNRIIAQKLKLEPLPEREEMLEQDAAA